MAGENEQSRVPTLRFPEFEEEWALSDLGCIADVKRGAGSQYITYVADQEDGVRLIRIGDFLESEPVYVLRTNDMARFTLQSGDILMAGTGATAGVTFSIPDEFHDMAYSYNAPRIRVQHAKKQFVYRYLKSPKIEKQQNRFFTGNAQHFLDTNDIRKLRIFLPSGAEQKKIAAFLGAVDEKLRSLRRKRDLLADYKRGAMQQLFSQKIRFKKDDGSPYPDWEEKKLGDIFERVTRKNAENNKNVLTISAQQGLVNQEDYFNKSVSAADVTGYYLLHRGDFAYNKSYSKGYPMGAIKRLNGYDKGVVSTLYICFSVNSEVAARYFEQYFEGGQLNRELQKIAQEGARNHGLLNLSVIEFFRDINIDLPHPDEQQKIANFLTAIDVKIDAVAEQIAAMEAFKKSLLQQMFV